MRITSTMTRKLVLGAGALALMAPLAACSSDDAADASDNTEPVAQVDQLTGKTTEVVLDAGFVEALGSLKVAPGVLGDAKLVDGSLIFPITGGDVTYYEPGSVSPYVQGNIEHEGSGLSLTAGGIEVGITDFAIDPGTQKVYGDVAVDGKSAADDAYIFHLDGSTLKPLQTGPNDTAILEGTKVMISGDAAALLNETFGTDGVTENLLVGTAKITINTK